MSIYFRSIKYKSKNIILQTILTIWFYILVWSQAYLAQKNNVTEQQNILTF